MKTVGEYLVTEELGRGSSGAVRMARHQGTGEMAAAKLISRSEHPLRDIQRETHVWKLVSGHPNIVSIKGLFAGKKYCYLLMEYCSGQSLADTLSKERFFGEDRARKVFLQLLSAVQHCHNHGLTHRDIKPENILFDGKGTLKLSDFGLSAHRSIESSFSTPCGTPQYTAPEVIEGCSPYDGERLDVWNCGLVLYIMVAGSNPFASDTLPETFQRITSLAYCLPTWLSPSLQDLLRHLLCPASCRITLQGVAQHPWLRPPESVAQNEPSLRSSDEWTCNGQNI